MIISRLIGGLGNQMFQYAFGRSLSIKHNVDLKLDVSGLLNEKAMDGFTKRDFDLNAMRLQAMVANETEINKFQKNRAAKIKDFISLSLPVKSNHFYLREPHFHFYPKALNAPANSYLDGYWHSEKYFLNIRNILLEEFRLKDISVEISSWSKRINDLNAVSIHVRRGDYLNSVNSKIYAHCDPLYYENAINKISNTVEKPVFLVFSDDLEWCRKNLNINHEFYFVNETGTNKNHDDLYLMSICKHNIIANSSFSWWGAWLNSNENKIVIAPDKWFLDSTRNTKDLIPQNWLVL